MIVEPSASASTLGCSRASSSPSSAEISNDSPNGRPSAHGAAGKPLNARTSERRPRAARRDCRAAVSAVPWRAPRRRLRSPSSKGLAAVLPAAQAEVPTRGCMAVCHGRLCQNVTEYRAASRASGVPFLAILFTVGRAMANPRELAEQAFALLQNALSESEARASELDEQLKRKTAPKNRARGAARRPDPSPRERRSRAPAWEQQAGHLEEIAEAERAKVGAAQEEARDRGIRSREAHQERDQLLARKSRRRSTPRSRTTRTASRACAASSTSATR